MEDLFKALNMFSEGVKTLQMQRSINQANEQVSAIRASEESEAKKRQALQDISNALVTQLASSGTPDTTIESVRNAFLGPTAKIGNANQLNLQGVMTGNEELKAQAKEQQAFEEDIQLKKLASMEKIKAEAAEAARKKFERGQAEAGLKDYTKFSDSINPEKQVRSAMGRAAITKQAGEKILALVGGDMSPENLNKLSNENLTEMAITVASMLKSGVPTGEEVKRFLKPTAAETKANIQQYLTANPQPSQRGALAKMLVDTAARETSVSQIQSNEYVINQLNKAKGLVRQHPELEGDIRSEVSRRMGINPEDVMLNVESQEPATTKQRAELDKKMDEAIKVFNRARMEIKSTDPKVRAQAQNFFKKTGTDPSHSLEQNKVLLKHFLSSRGQ